MPKCDKCGKRGLFLKLSNGLCNECLSLEQSVANNKRMNIAVSVPPETGLANPSAIIEKHTAVVEQTAIEPNGFDDSTFRLHPDLEGLIWFVDGKWKNCVDESINYDSTFIVRNNMRVEPSAIQTTLPISLPAEGDFVESLGYYPSYSGMSAVQRGKYLLFLCDPYQPIDIGYVFVLYYGLERFLITNDYQHAFEEILKLRDVHRNNSFQSYSSSALIYTAITKNRKDLLVTFLKSIDNDYERNISFDLFILLMEVFQIGIRPEDMMLYASHFGFTNKRYIKSDHSLFVEKLSKVLCEKYGDATYHLELFSDVKLPTHQMSFFANPSISATLEIPDTSRAYQFIEQGAAILQEAHNRVKQEKRKQQKNTNQF